jgi:LysM repeat protein
MSVLSEDTQKSIITAQSASKTNENPSNTIVNDIKNNNIYNSYNNSNGNKTEKKTITTSSFLSSLSCTNHVLQKGETLTQIARKYESTCNLNTTIKLIKSINNINDDNNIDSGTVIYIPESLITTGKLYPITTGDTWYNIAQKYYTQYDADSIAKVLIYINNLPNNDLPLGESLFLPSI